MTCLPAWAAATAIGRCVSLGVAITTASTESRRHKASGSVVACGDVPLGPALLEDLGIGVADRNQLGPRVQPQARAGGDTPSPRRCR